MSSFENSYAKKLLEFLQGLYAWQDEAALVQWIMDHLPDLVSGDNVMVGQHDPKTRTPLNVSIKHPTSRPHLLAEIRDAGMMKAHPFWTPNPDPDNPVKILSAMMTQAQWERSPMYCELLREDKVRDHITVEFVDDRKLYYIAIARSSRGCSRRDQETLAALAPHFKQAFNSAGLRRAANFFPGFNCQSPLSTLPVDQRGILPALERNKRGSLARLLAPGGPAVFEQLTTWIRNQADILNRGTVDSAISPFFVKQSRRVIEFRMHRQWGADGYLLSQRVIVDTNGTLNRLTPRERQVLHWVAEGKGNWEIAVILGLSRHTVKDHLKSIYEKLGVDNRTAAARLIYPTDQMIPPVPPR